MEGETGDSAVFPDIPHSIETGTEEQQNPALNYPVVGFGASAGGLQAFKEILQNLNPNTGMAFVLVTHLAPDQRSFLAEIVERYTQMPVLHPEDGQRPQPNHLYVLLPGQSLTIHDGKLNVQALPPGERILKTIDVFFYSLASDQKNHAIGVVLSRADSDGALGLKAIKGEGGIALVQTPESAVHGDMPRSSIESDHVDLALPPCEIAVELARIAQQFRHPAVQSLEEGLLPPDDEQSYQKILQLIRGSSGLDLRQYKAETIRRRIGRRMLLLRIDQLADYVRYLQMRTDELTKLQKEVLINVTRFFRDPGFWESFSQNVLPALVQERPPEKPIRVWCVGCSTGEEAYSLAITILEYLSKQGLDTPVQVFGTDANDQAIEIARAAVYPETIAADISAERLRRYFVKVDRGYQLSKRVRDICIFARQKLCSDPPFSHIDILSCRNVMIYFNQALQRQAMLTFHYALEPGGYILLGMSEGLRGYGEVFGTVDRKNRIYFKTGASLPLRYETPFAFAISKAHPPGRNRGIESESTEWPELELQRAADRIVVTRLGPPGLIIDENMRVLQSRGQISQFLQITPGAVSWNLLRVLRDGLANEVRAVAQRAIQENVPTSATAVLVDDQDMEHKVMVDVLPITSAAGHPRCFLVLFQFIRRDGEPQATFEQHAQPTHSPDEKDRVISQLRQDLLSTRFHLQSMVEERDARNQELVSANEEIQSANEELQSTNEELETTKEELQSANEELQTVNDELQQRNNILRQTGNDLSNLLNSVNIPLLILTSDLHIRQFTPPIQRLLNVRASDVGRSISEIRLQLSVEDIEPILSEVLETLETRELDVQDRDGRWHLLRVRPYRTIENKIDGLIVVLVDIDQLRRSQEYLADARDFARFVFESVPVSVVVANQDFTIRAFNSAFRKLAESENEVLETCSLPDLMRAIWGVDDIRKKTEALLSSPPGTLFEFEHESTVPSRKTLLIKALALSEDGKRIFLLVIEDITLRRDAELLIARQKHALESEIEIAARKLNRTQGELRELTAHLFAMQEEERQRVARELHDDISQRLSLIEIALQEIRAEDSSPEDQLGLRKVREQVHSLNTDVRHISHRLHPAILNDLGLSAALRAMVKEFGEREHMPVTYLTQELPESWSTEAATAVYRITQEALRNVAKHAGKTHVKVILSGKDDRLELRVMDFGIGFDQDAEGVRKGLGMISMQERARLAGGSLTIQSALGQGTTVIAEVQCDPHT